ncbi:TPA: hypothetical protein TY404_002070 [Streptococcus suis]|nr:hypothetical protein [Streptococcus suis]
MTAFELTFLTIALLSVTWMIITVIYALYIIRNLKNEIAHYQKPETQIEIANHVIRNRWYNDNVEVYK